MFSAYSILAKKRDGDTLTKEEINWFINGLLSGEIADYQMSALLMAMYLNGMDKDETAALTDAMLYSGRVLCFKESNIIDKHSTGGVGDKTSFILAPLAAACGVKVPMIAGRGLGHSGGTVDKVEAIEGFKTNLSLEEFQELLIKNDLVLIGQTEDIAPADKVLYSLRDVTATVESIPLITASIMSKKLAEGANGIVMDIKIGNGAFMKNLSKGRALAKSLSDTAKRFDKDMITVITDMNQPLGQAIGNSLEIIESIDTLKGKGPKDLTDLSIHLAAGMVLLAGQAKSMSGATKKVKEALKNGKALEKFRLMIEAQGGNGKVVDDYSLLPVAEVKTQICAEKSGHISKVDNKQLGLHCVSLGGGRKQRQDVIDFGVGLIYHKRVGQKVKAQEPLLTIYHNKDQVSLVEKIKESVLKNDIKISQKRPVKIPPLIYETKIHRNLK
jgi:pyrimidine-nucleoside phosphorylase